VGDAAPSVERLSFPLSKPATEPRRLGEAADGLDPLKTRHLAKTATLAKFLKTEYGPWFEANRKSGSPILKRLKHCFEEDFGSTRSITVGITQPSYQCTTENTNSILRNFMGIVIRHKKA